MKTIILLLLPLLLINYIGLASHTRIQKKQSAQAITINNQPSEQKRVVYVSLEDFKNYKKRSFMASIVSILGLIGTFGSIFYFDDLMFKLSCVGALGTLSALSLMYASFHDAAVDAFKTEGTLVQDPATKKIIIEFPV